MKILVTNDDGWGSTGIQVLESVAANFGEVWTIAPENPMSGISHQMTFERPMKFVKKASRSYSLDGTPADCVRVGLTQLETEFDWVFSGINKGANLGSDTNISGTVAAVREASLFNCPGIALSQHLKQFNKPHDWSKPSELSKRVIPLILEREIESRNWFNVNFPDTGDSDSKNVKIVETKLDPNPLPAVYQDAEDGQIIYCGKYKDRVRTPGFDADVCFSGSISITIH